MKNSQNMCEDKSQITAIIHKSQMTPHPSGNRNNAACSVQTQVIPQATREHARQTNAHNFTSMMSSDSLNHMHTVDKSKREKSSQAGSLRENVVTPTDIPTPARSPPSPLLPSSFRPRNMYHEASKQGGVPPSHEITLRYTAKSYEKGCKQPLS